MASGIDEPEDQHPPNHLTRRRVVQGIGVLSGATVLVAQAGAPAAGALPLPGASAGGQAPTGPHTEDPKVVTAGLTYISASLFDFRSQTDQAPTVSQFGAHATGTGADLIASLPIPSGALLKEVTFAGYNNSGSPASFFLDTAQLADPTTTGGIVTATLSTGSGVRLTTTTANIVVDGDYSYIFVAPTMASGLVQIAGARVGYVPPTPPGTFHPLNVPVRIYDSRPGALPTGGVKGKFTDHNERVLDAKLGTGVPAGASSVLVNVAATNTNPGGFFSLFRNGIAWPGTSTLNWGVANITVSSLASTQLSAGLFKARCEAPGGADLIVDVVGWFS